jgi:hypothetical protein
VRYFRGFKVQWTQLISFNQIICPFQNSSFTFSKEFTFLKYLSTLNPSSLKWFVIRMVVPGDHGAISLKPSVMTPTLSRFENPIGPSA